MKEQVKLNTRFSITGSGYFFKLFDEFHPLYQKLTAVKTQDLHRRIFELEHFKKLQLLDVDGKPYPSYLDVPPSAQFVVYAIDTLTRLEVRREKSKVLKFMFRDLIGNGFLFPPGYELLERSLTAPPLLIIEHDKGNFGTARLSKAFAQEEQLSFKLLQVPFLNKTFVEGVAFEGESLQFRKQDTLTYGVQVFRHEMSK